MIAAIVAAATFLSYFAPTNAHGGVTSIGVNGQKYTGWSPYNSAQGQTTAARPYSSFDPILSPTGSTLHCNNNGQSGPNQQTLTIPAGGTITAYYSQWTHAEGPFTVYLAACPSSGCTGVSSAGLQWFKIDEKGLISGTLGKGQWANGLLMANLSWSTKIPSTLRAGHYLIRWETLALHQANTPQFYPECAQIQVTGGGSDFPTSDYLKPIPGWGANDPGVMVNIYDATQAAKTTYSIPGPAIYPAFKS
ncbi:glycoside hydrolase family 61 protein [Serendipita vermifera]|nr:glycoside hydrolase family 61 protein [Serendipita vermifera]